MLRGGYWRMLYKTLTISILCCSLTGRQIIVCFHPIALYDKFYLMLTLVCCYSCVPLHNFDYVYHYLMGTNLSFIDS
jgi:hypothetical protein